MPEINLQLLGGQPNAVRRGIDDGFQFLTLLFKTFTPAAERKLEEELAYLAKEIKNSMETGQDIFRVGSEEGHTLDDFDQHRRITGKGPYSQPGDEVGWLQHDPRIVHVQTGKLRSNIRVESPSRIGDNSYFIGLSVDESIWYWRFIKYGTTKMIPRDVEGAILDSKIGGERLEDFFVLLFQQNVRKKILDSFATYSQSGGR